MNVTCPSCKARYSVDDARVPPSGVTIRCPTCSHTFVARRPRAEERARSAVALPGQSAERSADPKRAARGPAAPSTQLDSSASRPAGRSARPGHAVPLPGEAAASPPSRGGAVPLPGQAAGAPSRPAASAPPPTSDLDSLDLGLDDDAPDPGQGFGRGTLDFIDDAQSKARARPAPETAPELRVRRRNGRIEGPYGVDHIKALVRAGELSGSEDISEDGVAWRAMTSHPELNAVLNELAQAADAGLGFGQVDLDPGSGPSLDVDGRAASAAAPEPNGDLDLGLDPEPPPTAPAPPPSGPSAMDELMGNLELDQPEPSDRSPDPALAHQPAHPRAAHEALPDLPDELEVGEIPDMPPLWQTYKRPIVAFLSVCGLVLAGVITHFFTPYGAFGVPALVEILTYEPPPPPPKAPPPPPPKLADLEQVETLLDQHTYESYRSAIATLEQAGPAVPANALALAKARVMASLAYGPEAFPVAPARAAVAALGNVDPAAAEVPDPGAVEREKLAARAGLAVLEGEPGAAIPELERAAEAHPEDAELAWLLGAAHQAKGEPKPALAAFDRALVSDPSYGPAYRRIGQVVEDLDTDDATSEAAVWFDKAVDAQPKDARSALDAARLHGLLHHAGARRRALEKAAEGAEEGLLPKARAAALVTTVEAFDELGRIAEVKAFAEEAARLAPADPRAVAFAALAKAATGEAAQAVTQLDAVLRREPNNVEALIARARTQMAAGDVAKALLDLEKARKLEKGIEASMWLARFNRHLAKIQDAENVLRLAARKPGAAAAHVELARLALAEGNVDEAHAEAKAAAQAEPTSAEAHILLGRTLASRAQLDEALTAFEKALELDDEHIEARLGVANTLRDRAKRGERPVRSADLGRSIPIYLEALEAAPDDPTVLFEYGRVLELQGDFLGALELYERAAALDETDVRPHLKMVAAQLEKDPPAPALARPSLETAQNIELASGRRIADVRYWEARLALVEGNPKEAVKAMRLGTELEPRNARYHFLLGRALERNNSLYEAISAYERAVHLNSRLAEAQRALGRAAVERHRFDDAREYFAKYRKVAPEDASIWSDIGDSFARQNKDAQALDAFGKALRANPRDVRALIQTGLIYSRKGRERDARRRFARATEVVPERAEPWCLLGISQGQIRLTRSARAALEKCLELEDPPPDLRVTAEQLLGVDN